MKFWKTGLVALFVGGTQFASAAEYTGRLIVKLRMPAASAQMHTIMSANQASTLSQIAGVQLAAVRAMSGGGQVVQLPQTMTVAEAQAVADKLQSDPGVEYAEPDYIRRPMLVPNDTSYGSQWNLNSAYGIQAPAAWDITTGSIGVVVAVLDTGITDHTELSNRMLQGYDFITEPLMAGDGDGSDADPHDQGDGVSVADKAALVAMDSRLCTDVVPPTVSSWHGTAMSGLIGAISNNSAGVAGINWVSKILPVRVMGKCGGYVSDIVDGMRWAAGLSVSGAPANPNPAKVLNLSLGSTGTCLTTEQNAIDEIVALNKVVVAAAGNESGNVVNSAPANCSGVIAVAATTRSGSRTSISNTGSLVAISAPGGEWNDGIYMLTNTGTTVPVSDSYGGYYGTSAAAAAVSGVVSLMFSVNSQLSPAQVKNILQSTATAFPNGTCTITTCGAGIVNAAAAVSLASATVGVPYVSPSGGGGGGGGGCAFSSGESFEPMLAGMAGAALTGLFWRRTRQQ